MWGASPVNSSVNFGGQEKTLTALVSNYRPAWKERLQTFAFTSLCRRFFVRALMMYHCANGNFPVRAVHLWIAICRGQTLKFSTSTCRSQRLCRNVFLIKLWSQKFKVLCESKNCQESTTSRTKEFFIFNWKSLKFNDPSFKAHQVYSQISNHWLLIWLPNHWLQLCRIYTVASVKVVL